MEVEGGSGGITGVDRLWHQDAGLIEVSKPNDYFGTTLAIGNVEESDYFGHALAAGEFDGFADLAIGATGEDHDGIENAGHANLMYGSQHGLENSGFNDEWHQN